MRKRNPDIAWLPVEFQAQKDHIVAVFFIGGSTIGIRFNSPEQMLEFFQCMMGKAAIVWPDNEWVKEYLS